MSDTHFDIHHRIVEVHKQILEAKRAQRLLDAVIAQIEPLQREIRAVKQQREILERRMAAHAALTVRDPEWLRRKNMLQESHQQTQLHLNWLHPQVSYHVERRAELEGRITSPEHLELLKAEFGRLRQRQLQILQGSDIVPTPELHDVTESIAAVKLHIVELDEALTICLKVIESLRDILQAARDARSAVFTTATINTHVETHDKLTRTHAQLEWLQRELWDAGLEFNPMPELPDITDILTTAYPPLFSVVALPKRIQRVLNQTLTKSAQINRELASSRRLLEQLENKQHDIIDRLWRPSVLRQLSPETTIHRMLEDNATEEPVSTQHATLVVVEQPEQPEEPILRIGIRDL